MPMFIRQLKYAIMKGVFVFFSHLKNQDSGVSWQNNLEIDNSFNPLVKSVRVNRCYMTGQRSWLKMNWTRQFMLYLLIKRFDFVHLFDSTLCDFALKFLLGWGISMAQLMFDCSHEFHVNATMSSSICLFIHTLFLWIIKIRILYKDCLQGINFKNAFKESLNSSH